MTYSLATADLASLETRIERGIETFMDVGLALLEIRERRLYHDAGHTTFEHYCAKRWGIKQSRAYQLIDAAHVARALTAESSTIVELSDDGEAVLGDTLPAPPVVLPKNEAQTRELARLKEPATIREVWHEAATAHDGKPTAKDIRAIADERLKPSLPTADAEAVRASMSEQVQLRVGDLAHIPPAPAPSREEKAWALLTDLHRVVLTLDPADVARMFREPATAAMYYADMPAIIAWATAFRQALYDQAHGTIKVLGMQRKDVAS